MNNNYPIIIVTTYSDINLTFKKHPGTGDVLRKTDVEAVKTSIKSILLGEGFDIPFDPNYGGAMRSLLFENLSEGVKAATERRITLKLAEYEPRAIIEHLKIKDSGNSVDVILKFYVIGNPIEQILNIVIERVR